MKIAVYQMELIGGSPEVNQQKVSKWVEQVMESENPDLIVLPELWTTSYWLEELTELAEERARDTKDFLRKLAKAYHIQIIGGSVANKVNGKIYNTSFVFERNGELVYEYSKIHLVPMLDEPKYITGGEEKVEVFELDGVKMGIIICYDLRFPELARKLALEGAQVLFVPAEWPKARTNHWIHLNIARSIENQMYVVAVNNAGKVRDVVYAGNSMLIDPWGEVLQRGTADREETLVMNVDLETVKKIRRDVPIFSSRVEKLY